MTKKRIVALLLVAVLALSLVVMPAPNAEAAGEYTIRLADEDGNNVVTAAPGDTVTLVLSMENNPGIIGVAATVAYPNGITISKRPKDVSTFEDVADVVRTYSPNLTTNPYLLWWNLPYGDFDQKLVVEECEMAEITFKVAADAAAGDYELVLAAPADKNTTASVDGDGVILPNTNTPVTNISLVNCTIRVQVAECAPDAHTWGDWADVEGSEPTCDVGGKQGRTCSTCGKYEEKDVAASGHSYTTYTETKPATCVDNKQETATCDNGCGETDTRVVENTATGVHNFQGQPYIDKDPATCLDNGTHYRECSVCGAKEEATEIENSKLDHSYTGTALTYKATDANCHAKATYYHVCVNGCGGQGTTTFEAGNVDKTKHDGETQLRNAEPATEQAPGYTGDLYCLGCGDMIQQGSPIPQQDHTHQMNKTAAQPKSCTQSGNIEYYTCSKCNKLYKDKDGITEVTLAQTVIPASHEPTKVSAQPKSCTQPGNIEYYDCDACGKLFSDAACNNEITQAQTVVPASHEIGKVNAQPKSCTEPGNIEHYKCSVCNKLFSDAAGNNEITQAQTVIAASHEIGKVNAKPKSCTEPGNIEHYKCSACNKLFSDAAGNNETTLAQVQIPASHELTKTPANAESCTEPGNIEYYTCSVCQKKFSDAAGKTEVTDVVIPAAHKLTKTEAKAATCTEPGNIEYYTCSVCQKIFSDAEGKTEVTKTTVDALGHKIEKVDAKDATCDEQGNIEHYACVNGCGTCYEDAEGETVLEANVVFKPALGHKMVEHKGKDATVDAEGSITYYECETCDKLYKDAEGKEEVKKEDTVLPKLPKPESVGPANGDSFNASLWIAVMLLACLSLAVTVVIRKRVIS